QLTKPNALYGPLAEANGFTPEAINSHTNLELSHETSLQGQTEAAENPVATFSEVNAPTDEDDLDCDDDDDNNNDNGDDDDNNNNDNGDDDDNNNNDNGDDDDPFDCDDDEIPTPTDAPGPRPTNVPRTSSRRPTTKSPSSNGPPLPTAPVSPTDDNGNGPYPTRVPADAPGTSPTNVPRTSSRRPTTKSPSSNGPPLPTAPVSPTDGNGNSDGDACKKACNDTLACGAFTLAYGQCFIKSDVGSKVSSTRGCKSYICYRQR
ncbi:hypothetical protein DYB31_002605, partial [Aphanomyces astaci]